MTIPDEQRRQVLESLYASGDGPIVTSRLCEMCRVTTATSGASVMLITDDVTRGSICVSDDISELIEELQYTLGEGPCIDAHHQRQPVVEPDLAEPRVARWAAFGPPAVAAGVRAVFGFPISVGPVRLGALSLYRNRPGPLTVVQHADAVLLADAAAQLIIDLQTHAAPGAIGPGLEAAGNFRFVVHQAAGMVAVQLAIDVADALIRLRAYAFVNGRGVSDVAADVVARQLRFDRIDDR